MKALRLIATAGFAVADLCAVVALVPDWRDLGHGLAAPHRWVGEAGTDEATITLASAAVWIVTLWLALGLLATCGAALPGVAGHAGRQLARRLLPGVLLRAVAGFAGLGVLLSPVGAVAKTPGAATVAAGRVTAAVGPVPSWPTDLGPVRRIQVGWPTSPMPPSEADSTPTAARAAHPGPTPPSTTHLSPRPPRAAHASPTPPSAADPSTMPSSAAHPRPTPPRASQPTPASGSPAAPGHPFPDAGQAAPGHTVPDAGQAAPDGDHRNTADTVSVRVEPGDSLWLIAAKRLGAGASDADIAAVWPRWYLANAGVIGDDPALIRPGQVLQAPAASS